MIYKYQGRKIPRYHPWFFDKICQNTRIGVTYRIRHFLLTEIINVNLAEQQPQLKKRFLRFSKMQLLWESKQITELKEAFSR